MAGEGRKEAARDISRASETETRLPATLELRCGLGPFPGDVFGPRPVAVVGLTAATSVAFVAELVVRLLGLDERDRES